MKPWDSWIGESTKRYGGVMSKNEADLQNAYQSMRGEGGFATLGGRQQSLIMADQQRAQEEEAMRKIRARGG